MINKTNIYWNVGIELHEIIMLTGLDKSYFVVKIKVTYLKVAYKKFQRLKESL